MARLSSGWSRLWGALGAAGFWLALGAALLDAAVIGPLWISAPPASVRAWAAVALHPEPERILVPLTLVIAAATLLAWLSSLGVRGSRRLWLTLAMVAACASVWASAVQLGPVERAVAAAVARDDLELLALAQRWLQWSAARLAALLVGSYCAYRAHLAAVVARRQASLLGRRAVVGDSPRPSDAATFGAREREIPRRRRRRDDFVWSEDDE